MLSKKAPQYRGYLPVHLRTINNYTGLAGFPNFPAGDPVEFVRNILSKSDFSGGYQVFVCLCFLFSLCSRSI